MRFDRDYLKFPAIVLAMAVALFAAVYFPGCAHSQTTAISPVATSSSVNGTSIQIVGVNPTRNSIRICNTGSTNAVWIWPGPLTTVVSDYILAPISSNVITCYTPPSGLIAGTGSDINVGNSWNASSSATTVSVEEWF